MTKVIGRYRDFSKKVAFRLPYGAKTIKGDTRAIFGYSIRVTYSDGQQIDYGALGMGLYYADSGMKMELVKL